ncbi:hypothetical protein Tco_1210272 [Tanacetum coccineum]
MLVLPADPGLWSEVISRWESEEYEDYLRRSHEDFQPLPRIFTETIFNILGYEVNCPWENQFPLLTQIRGVTYWKQSQGYREPVVMSSASSAVTYTSVYTNFEPGRAFWGADDKTEEWDDADDEEEEEHLAPADSAVVVPTVKPDSPPEGTESVIPPPSTDITTNGARITVRLQASISLPPEAGVERLLAMPTPSPSPPISLSPPSAGERLARCTVPSVHSSPPLVPSPLLPSSGCPTQTQTLRMASTQALVDVVTAALPSPPLPPLPPSLYIPPPVDRMDDLPESELPPRKRLCLSNLGSKYKVRESSTARPTGGRGIDYGFVSTVDDEARRQGISEIGYGIRDTWVDPAEAVSEISPTTIGEVNTRVTELAELHERDTQDLYALLEDAQDGDNMDCGEDAYVPSQSVMVITRNDI